VVYIDVPKLHHPPLMCLRCRSRRAPQSHGARRHVVEHGISVAEVCVIPLRVGHSSGRGDSQWQGDPTRGVDRRVSATASSIQPCDETHGERVQSLNTHHADSQRSWHRRILNESLTGEFFELRVRSTTYDQQNT
jgi:hypothetical protein